MTIELCDMRTRRTLKSWFSLMLGEEKLNEILMGFIGLIYCMWFEIKIIKHVKKIK